MAVDHLPSFVNYLYISSDHFYTVVLNFFLLIGKRSYSVKNISLLSYELQMFSHLSSVLALFMVGFFFLSSKDYQYFSLWYLAVVSCLEISPLRLYK